MEQISELLNKMPAPNLEHQPQESKPLRTSDENKLAESVKDTRLSTMHFNDALSALKEALRYAMVKVGLRAQSFPTDIEKAVLITHVLDNYGNHTASEIRLAFDMAISGSLDVDPVCYENFSCLYFSGIMNAYRKWAKQAYEQIEREPQPINEKQISMGKVHWGGEINNAYQKIKSGKFISYVTFPVEFYGQLCDDGFIERDEYLSSEHKKKKVFELFELAIKNDINALYERSNP